MLLGWKRRLSVAILIMAASSQAATVDSDSDGSVSEANTIEDYVVFFFCVLLGLVISLVTVVIGYTSAIEDSLIRMYRTQGKQSQATIKSKEFARTLQGQESTVCTCSRSGESGGSDCEYNVFITYKLTDAANDKVVVSKQVKMIGKDIVESTKVNVPCSINLEVHGGEKPRKEDLPCNIVEEGLSLGSNQDLSILVLAGYPKSALPVQYVQRLCRWRYRLPTYSLLLALFLMSTGSYWFGLRIAPLGFERPLTVSLSATLCSVSLLYFCFHTSLGEAMKQALYYQYLEGGEEVFVSTDDSTIATGADSFLNDSAYWLLSTASAACPSGIGTY